MQKRNQKGFSLVELLIVVAIIGIIAAIAIPSLLAARRASNESSAVGNLRTLGSANATYLATTGQTGDFAALVANGNLDAQWTTGAIRNNYVFTDTASAAAGTFDFSCVPQSPSDGTRSFNIVEDYVIRFLAGSTAPVGTAGTAIGVE